MNRGKYERISTNFDEIRQNTRTVFGSTRPQKTSKIIKKDTNPLSVSPFHVYAIERILRTVLGLLCIIEPLTPPAAHFRYSGHFYDDMCSTKAVKYRSPKIIELLKIQDIGYSFRAFTSKPHPVETRLRHCIRSGSADCVHPAGNKHYRIGCPGRSNPVDIVVPKTGVLVLALEVGILDFVVAPLVVGYPLFLMMGSVVEVGAPILLYLFCTCGRCVGRERR